MSFEAVDDRRFPGLKLAWQTLEGANGATAVLNAANEVAVQAFLEGQIRFDQIHAINDSTLQAWDGLSPTDLEGVLALDQRAREAAQQRVNQLT